MTQGARDTIFLAFASRFGPWSGLGVLRTASVSIWRSSAFVLGGSRVLDFCQLAIHPIWGCPRQNATIRSGFRICAGHKRRNGHQRRNRQKKAYKIRPGVHVHGRRCRPGISSSRTCSGLQPATGHALACWVRCTVTRCRNRTSASRTDNPVSWTDDLIASAMYSGLKRPASCSAVRLTTRDPSRCSLRRICLAASSNPRQSRARTRPPEHNRSHQSPTSGSLAERCSGRRDDCCASPHPS